MNKNKELSASCKISIIFVNYYTENYIYSALVSIQKQVDFCADEFEVIIFNNSPDCEQLNSFPKEFNFPVLIINSPNNVGFGAGCNLAVNNARGEFILLLNPDAEIQETTFLSVLYTHAVKNEKCGISASRILEYDYKGREYQYGPFYHYAYNWQPESLPANEIASVIGAVIFMKKDLFLLLDGFDKDFFMYGEDIDLCLRVRQQGYKICVLPEISVKHIGGVSEKRTDSYNYRMKKMRGDYLFCLKHFPEKLFESVIKQDIKLAKMKKIKLWLEINILMMKRKQNKYFAWCAVYDAAKQTQHSTDWLFNK